MNLSTVNKILKTKKRSRFPEDEEYIFGFKDNYYYLNSPIDEKKLVAIETYFSIKFPKEYRKFILEIGNGGAGPAYGFLSLEMSLTRLIKYMYDSDLGITLDNYLSIDFKPTEDKDWNASGIFPICNFGCSRHDFLVVSGKEKGNIWTYVEDVGFFPKEPPNYYDKARDVFSDEWLSELLSSKNQYRMRFDDWYKLWLYD